jgi:hypothetical protein
MIQYIQNFEFLFAPLTNLCLRSLRSAAKLMSPEIKITADGLPCLSANRLKACLNFSSAAFLHIEAT